MARDAVDFLRELGRLREHALGVDRVHATWAAQSFVPFWRQRLSVAVHMGTALELSRAVAQGEEHLRSIVARKPLH